MDESKTNTSKQPEALALGASDAQAVDALLDRAGTMDGATLAGEAPRVQAAGQLLGLLDAMPAPIPSDGLAQRAMDRVLESGPAGTSAAALSPTLSKPSGSVGRTFANAPDAPRG